jgi:hypothetical protein
MQVMRENAGRLFFATKKADFAIFEDELFTEAMVNSNNQPTTRKSIVRSVVDINVLHFLCFQ